MDERVKVDAIVEAILGRNVPTDGGDPLFSEEEAQTMLRRLEAAGYAVVTLAEAAMTEYGPAPGPHRVAGNNTVEVLADRSNGGGLNVFSYPLERMDYRADLACRLVERWGVSTLEGPEELARRAVETVEKMRDLFSARAWLFPQPSYDEVHDHVSGRTPLFSGKEDAAE